MEDRITPQKMEQEATGSWDWLVDEMEEAGLISYLAQPFAARSVLGTGSKKTDTVDALCLATLLRNGVSQVYERLRQAKGHQKAAVTLARHLAESAWWV
jgi:hypothetical protein